MPVCVYRHLCAHTQLCDNFVTCDGQSMTCPPTSVNANGTVCRPAVGTCDVTETCVQCDAMLHARGVRVSDDGVRSCDGIAATCPPEAFLNGVVCRHRDGADCDIDETCDGTSAACPPDRLVSLRCVVIALVRYVVWRHINIHTSRTHSWPPTRPATSTRQRRARSRERVMASGVHSCCRLCVYCTACFVDLSDA
jgi:hypothetical protein